MENPEETTQKAEEKLLSSIKLVLKSASNLCDDGKEADVKNAKVCFRIGEKGTSWMDKASLEATSTLHSEKKDIKYNDETFNLNTANIKSPELAIRVYGNDTAEMSVDTDGNKTKAYLGETIILLEKDSAELNMGVMEQTVTLQDGARDNVVVV